MNIKQLVIDLPCLIEVRGNADTDILSLSADSRKIEPGALFFCIRGIKVDAHQFAPQALAAGAAALVVERPLDVDAPQIVVSDARLAMNYIAQAFYGHPARRMKMIGITGTKGKSTTCFLIKSILQQAGYKVGLIGTIMTMIGDKRLPSDLTTPDPIELERLLRQMADEGVDIVTMEVSAHALALHKLDGIVYDAVAFTNLSHDHLDFFGTPEKYFAAKRRLLTPEFARMALLNGDDEHAASIFTDLKVPHERYAIREKANIYAGDIEFDARGLSFTLHFHKRYELEIHLKLSGLFNVYNSLCAAAVCDALGVAPEYIKMGLEAVANVPGRMEVLDTGTPYQVILDYAHSPDSLDNVLRAVRQFAKGRVIVVFGCGGNRDREKRPVMGRIGADLADYCVLTSDNPRGEDPMDILAAIEEGTRPEGKPYSVIENRREAIKHAMSIAREGDVVVLAGKGHETYQEIMGQKHPFDEKVVVQELLAELY